MKVVEIKAQVMKEVVIREVEIQEVVHLEAGKHQHLEKLYAVNHVIQMLIVQLQDLA
ncbi:hypothetical protein ARNL5_01330 [Anaerolineae bacterium]|nr:hypothetical protein ARNL5_01330 [Anaerolineae bacterium]